MTNAHCHLPLPPDATSPTAWLCAAQLDDFTQLPAGSFFGVHPWYAETTAPDLVAAQLEAVLQHDPTAKVGEIGLDRLHSRATTAAQLDLFLTQLELAARYRRVVTLHGAKCWGEVVKAVTPFAGQIPAFLFHGFSRSTGLLPQIVQLNGYLSVGAAVLNSHAVNYRTLVRTLPRERLLLETDTSPLSLTQVLTQTAELLGITPAELEAQTDANAQRFLATMKG